MGDESEDPSERVNPRTRRVRQVVLDAAVEVLLELGPDQVTASAVAERADVARTTIYRHWPDQGSLLLAAIDCLASPRWFQPSDEGVLAVDLRSTLMSLCFRLTTRETRLVFGALASQAAQSETFTTAQQQFVSHLTQPIESVLETARERGAVDGELDCELQASMLAAPILHRHLMLYVDPTEDLVDAILSTWLAVHDRDPLPE